jgi:hypothetical protein
MLGSSVRRSVLGLRRSQHTNQHSNQHSNQHGNQHNNQHTTSRATTSRATTSTTALATWATTKEEGAATGTDVPKLGPSEPGKWLT